MSLARGRPKAGKVVACPACGKEKYRAPSEIARGRGCCSMACRDKMVREKRVRDGEARCARCRQWKPLAEFVRGTGGRPHSYCKPCSSEWFHELRGTPPEKRKAYRPAYKLTPEEKRLRRRELGRRQHQARRAGGKPPPKHALGKIMCEQDARCAYCGILLDKYHVDHKTPISKGGTNELSNLHLTCPRCNMRKGAMTHEEFLASKKRPVRRWDQSETDRSDGE